MGDDERDPLFGAAILKLTFLMKGIEYQPGFRFVYFGTLKKFGLTDAEVDAYIEQHREDLLARIYGDEPGD